MSVMLQDDMECTWYVALSRIAELHLRLMLILFEAKAPRLCVDAFPLFSCVRELEQCIYFSATGNLCF